MGKNMVCERCGKPKPVENFISRIYPERGPGILCQFCRRKDQRKLTYKQKKKLEAQERRLERQKTAKKKAISKRYERARYVKEKQESAKWLKYMKREERSWDCGVRKNAKLWREHLELTNSIPDFAKKETLLEFQRRVDKRAAEKVRRNNHCVSYV